MKLIIDIPEKTLKYYVTLANKGEQIGSLERIVLNGTPLPKEHGRIIDESQIRHIICYTKQELYRDKIHYVKATDAPTIIESDRGSDSE